ncbi:MAG: 30S ribosomal protein S4e [Candidatus Micrarchaeia archaeon]|jgi:small subunit ribosomal protein S4e
MASHGKKRHMKRLARPKAMPISTKKYTYLKKASAGAHAKNYSLPLSTFLVEILNVAKTGREARKLLRAGMVFVDGKAVRDAGFPIGLMDVISISLVDKYLRVSVAKGKLSFTPISKEQVSQKLCKIVSKKQLAKDKFQIGLHDGRNIMVADAKKYSTGGTLKIAVPSQKVEDYLALQKGATCLVDKGVHAGTVAVLEELIEREASRATDAKLKTTDGKVFTTRKDYLFVVNAGFQ